MTNQQGQHFNTPSEELRLADQEHRALVILKWIAMVLLVVDHASLCMGNFMPGRIIGRLAFPIFAYLIVVGMRYTSNQGRYLKRIFIFALISEIPYNLMINMGYQSYSHIGNYFPQCLLCPSQQNILFTFSLAMAAIMLIRKVGYDDTTKTYKPHAPLYTGLITAVAAILGQLLHVDYGGIAVAAIVVVHTSMYGVGYDRIRPRYGQIILIVCIAILVPLASYLELVASLGKIIPFTSVQPFAFCALPLLMLSRGVRASYGAQEKKFNKLFYLVYPVHMVILVVIMIALRGL